MRCQGSSSMLEEETASTVQAAAERALGFPVRLTDTVASGRNSRVYRAEAAQGEPMAIKLFHRTHGGARNYLEAEMACLRFLWTHGERRVPRLIAAEQEAGLLICEFVEGEGAMASGISDSDIDEAIDFLGSLRQLAHEPGSENLPMASEACFSVQAIVESIKQRRYRLSQEGNHEALGGALGAFLEDEFDPAVVDAVTWSRRCLEHTGTRRMIDELPVSQLTLSPSDFGFHNCLRRTDGSLVFHDFEHFGWDDPAKLVSDVVLHPAMVLLPPQAERFVSGVVRQFGDDDLARRLRVVEPLYGLKWCALLLNEFIPSDLARRRFASSAELDWENLLQDQLGKARIMLHRVRVILRQEPHTE